MKSLILLLILFSFISSPEAALDQLAVAQDALSKTKAANLTGRWTVKFNISGVGEKNLVLEAGAKGSGSMLLLDAAPDGRPATASLPAVWTRTATGRFSVSSEAELPIGTCCREMGTLIFKGELKPDGSIAGAAIFVTSTVDAENPTGFRSLVGAFTARRVSSTD